MRRSSLTPAAYGHNQEPLIVVEESGNDDEFEMEPSNMSSPRQSLDIDSPVNPYLLSPWRDPRETRKHSLPTPSCTSGITASQVRRLSERGGEGSGPTPREAAFLATLSQAPAPTPGGRRHSVVTISKVPITIFGRNRRESIAACPNFGSGKISSRRDSGTTAGVTIGAANTSGGPPSTDHRGSVHNLQLDIMDDIVQSRKARMKLWNTSSEKVCEVSTVEETGGSLISSTMRYTNRRFSDFVGTSLTPIQSSRRASENPQIVSPLPLPSVSRPTTSLAEKMGIIVSNSDLVTLLSSLTSSATEINKCGSDVATTPIHHAKVTRLAPPTPTSHHPHDPASGDGSRKSSIKSSRSNSFDVSILNNAKQLFNAAGPTVEDKNSSILTGWFTKRHQPIAKKRGSTSSGGAAGGNSGGATVSFSKEVLDRFLDKESKKGGNSGSGKESRKMKWDSKSSFVDPHAIGTAIEGFLRRGPGSSSKGAVPKKKNSSGGSGSGANSSSGSGGASSGSSSSTNKSSGLWFGKSDEDDSKDSCEASLCSTLKDLFVK